MAQPDQRAGGSLRELSVGCVRCLWTLNLKASSANPEHYDITPLDGWTIAPGESVLCERCSDGWQPRIVEMSAALMALEQWDMLTLDAEGRGVATADAPWARALIRAALTGPSATRAADDPASVHLGPHQPTRETDVGG